MDDRRIEVLAAQLARVVASSPTRMFAQRPESGERLSRAGRNWFHRKTCVSQLRDGLPKFGVGKNPDRNARVLGPRGFSSSDPHVADGIFSRFSKRHESVCFSSLTQFHSVVAWGGNVGIGLQEAPRCDPGVQQGK
jgi:hypothetical protein